MPRRRPCIDAVFVGQIDAGRQAGRGSTYILVSRTFVFVVLFAVAFCVARPAQAQNWSFDARRIALGGIGDYSTNVAYHADRWLGGRAVYTVRR